MIFGRKESKYLQEMDFGFIGIITANTNKGTGALPSKIFYVLPPKCPPPKKKYLMVNLMVKISMVEKSLMSFFNHCIFRAPGFY